MSTAAWLADVTTAVRFARKAILYPNTDSRFNVTVEGCPTLPGQTQASIIKPKGRLLLVHTQPFTLGPQTLQRGSISAVMEGLRVLLK